MPIVYVFATYSVTTDVEIPPDAGYESAFFVSEADAELIKSGADPVDLEAAKQCLEECDPSSEESQDTDPADPEIITEGLVE